LRQNVDAEITLQEALLPRIHLNELRPNPDADGTPAATPNGSTDAEANINADHED